MEKQKISFRTCLLFVRDVHKSKEFYRKLLNRDPVEDLENFTSFDLEGTFLNLHPVDSKSPFSEGGSVGYFCVERLDVWTERAVTLGAQIWRGPLQTGTGWSIVQIKDPFGNIIGFEALNLPDINQLKAGER